MTLEGSRVARVVSDVDYIPIKEYIEAILAEKDRALAMASDEREKAAAALRNEQQRALDQAEREREKSAENLRTEMARAIKEGDDRLREHISNQVSQIKSALESADKLEQARIRAVDEKATAQAELAGVRQMANETAILKAEQATEKRFEGMNEFRAQLSDQAAKFVTRTELESLEDKLVSIAERNRADIEALAKRLA